MFVEVERGAPGCRTDVDIFFGKTALNIFPDRKHPTCSVKLSWTSWGDGLKQRTGDFAFPRPST